MKIFKHIVSFSLFVSAFSTLFLVGFTVRESTAQQAISQTDNKASHDPNSTVGGTSRQWNKRPLIKPIFEDSADARFIAKPVLKYQLIDDMETQSLWIPSPNMVEMKYTNEIAKSGKRSLRFKANQRDEDVIRNRRFPNGSFTAKGPIFEFDPKAAAIRLKLDPVQDWSAFNRISLWCYLHPTNRPINNLSIQFLSDGAPAGPLDPTPVHSVADLKPGEWNHITWEIPEYQRDKVSEFIIFMPMWGVSKEGQDPMFICDFDDLRVELVEADYYEGWEVAPGRISFNHTGYLPAGEKLAIAGELGVDKFELVDASTGNSVAAFNAKPLTNKRGKFRVLDFSSFTRPGTYILKYGDIKTKPFAISDDVFIEVLKKNLNGLYGMRCGFDIPEIHDACHMDAFAIYNGEKRPISGAWHDAGNVPVNSSETMHITMYLLSAYDVLKGRLHDKDLEEKILEEARWGLEWIMKTNFGKGMRLRSAPYDVYTDNKIGTIDDVIIENTIDNTGNRRFGNAIGNDPFRNILSAGVTAYASRLLKSIEPGFSSRLLDSAEDEFAAYIKARKEPPPESGSDRMFGNSLKDEMGYSAFAAVQMYLATGNEEYKEHAARFGRDLLAQQEQTFIDGIPITGYFYKDEGRKQLIQTSHFSDEDSALLGLKALCESLPDHPDWIKWYAGTVLYSEYFLHQGSKISEPYNLIPTSLYRKSDLDELKFSTPQNMGGQGGQAFKPSPGTTSQLTQEVYEAQKLRMLNDGTRLSENYWLRVFPIWPDQYRHGNTNIHLSMTSNLSNAAQIRNQRSMSELARYQLQWILGGNPFSKSIMYGVGYDYQQLFLVTHTNIVGSLPVGMNSLYNDAPYWPSNTIYPHKEIWGICIGRMLYNLAFAGAPALVSGTAPEGAVFREAKTGDSIEIKAGTFEKSIPAGDYEISYGGLKKNISLVDGGKYKLILDPGQAIAFELLSMPYMDGKVTVQARVSGTGRHSVELRVFNGSIKKSQQNVRLVSGVEQTISWDVKIDNPDTPWVLVAIPDGNTDEHKELYGTVRELSVLE